MDAAFLYLFQGRILIHFKKKLTAHADGRVSRSHFCREVLENLETINILNTFANILRKIWRVVREIYQSSIALCLLLVSTNDTNDNDDEDKSNNYYSN